MKTSSIGHNYASFHNDIMWQDAVPEINIIAVTFEAKFSDISFEFGKTLYHVTLASSLKKIARDGLTPRSQNEVFRYPDRVYLFNNAQLSLLLAYACGKAENSGVQRFAVLKVDSAKLQSDPLYKSGKLKFYVD